MIPELAQAVLQCDLPQYGLERGDIGTVVMVHEQGAGYELEFTALDGDTLAVVTLSADQVRPVGPGEIAHSRELPG